MASLNHHQAIAEFTRNMKKQLSGNLKAIRLFGSVARGTETPESDIDLLVLVNRDDKATREIIMDITVEINLDFDVVIAPVIMSNEH